MSSAQCPMSNVRCQMPETECDPLVTSVRQMAAEFEMLPGGCVVLAAVSGGQDSCALLHSLASIRDDLDFALYAAHLHHGIRGEDADLDADFVKQLAVSLDVPVIIERKDVPGTAKRRHLSIQASAREERHAFLKRASAQVGADRIALGHTRDDRIETVLINIIRGTGTDGLRGVRPVQENRIRPLLDVPREDTAAYCARHGIAFRDDRSNRSVKYMRNRIREELLPMLASYYNPAIREAMLRLSDIAGSEADYLDSVAREALQSALMNREEAHIVLKSEALRWLHPAILRRTLRVAMSEVRGTLHDIDASAIEKAVLSLGSVDQESSIGFTLAGGDATLSINENRITIARIQPPASARPVEEALALPGRTEIPELNLKALTEFCVYDPVESPAQTDWTLMADADRLAPPLTLRTRRDGDRIRALGMSGEKKLQDLFVDRKVPAAQRAHIPVVCDSKGIIWVVGHAVAERVRAREDTRNCLLIQIQPMSAQPGES